MSLERRPSNAAWSEGQVDRSADHFVLRYDPAQEGGPHPGVVIALVGRGSKKHQLVVEFVPTPDIEGATLEAARQAVRAELDFYLVTKEEPDPWRYAIYHCTTAANAYSRVHWGYFPAGHVPSG